MHYVAGGGGYTVSLACSPILVSSAAYFQRHSRTL